MKSDEYPVARMLRARRRALNRPKNKLHLLVSLEKKLKILQSFCDTASWHRRAERLSVL